MPEFLELLPPGEALKVLLGALPHRKPPVEGLDIGAAVDRVIAQDIHSPDALPPFDRSTVDGYAVRAADTFGASETLPAYLRQVGEVPMGAKPEFDLLPGETGLIHTGGMLPAGADAVLMLENSQVARPGEIEVLRSVAQNENVLHAGEDVAVGELILAGGTRLRPAEIGGLSALGITRVDVACKPRVGILSSGDEVVPPDVRPQYGQIRDVNSYSLAALVTRRGGMPDMRGIIPDQAAAFETHLRKALQECDLVVMTAGSSASTRDLTAQTIQQMGAPGVLVHGVNVKPGKPTILGVCDGKPVIGLPGNPVSAMVIAGLFVSPVIDHLLGLQSNRPEATVSARLSINLASQAGREDFVPVRLVQTDQGMVADPIFYKSNLIFSLARADGLVHIPADATGLPVNASVDVRLI
ncbi:molybdopterin molybdochelatase [Longilinea arvoryzae]|uniref:Molybdopterin molybdenumtransferase n=1 Tax=Longilinea arvoryzae TaxID=360412 RepID=A0A0S7BN76_9CHLR|nr:gephyrin-like molybdotransferase Glp [Longilinea arvoryzae]GAP15194.1 molybdopterin molybdochelatase [Longilinea arvoryzae]